MKEEMIRVGILDAKTREFNVGEIRNDLQTFYEVIDCDTIDIAVRDVYDQTFDIIVDDEGLLKEDPIVTAIDTNFQPMLVGTLIFCHHDSEGNLTSISEEDEHRLRLATISGYAWPCSYL